MKPIKIISESKEQQETDWSVPMWVKSVENGILIYTTGKHDGNDFEGNSLPCGCYPSGKHSSTWNKDYFRPITSPITIEISN